MRFLLYLADNANFHGIPQPDMIEAEEKTLYQLRHYSRNKVAVSKPSLN